MRRISVVIGLAVFLVTLGLASNTFGSTREQPPGCPLFCADSLSCTGVKTNGTAVTGHLVVEEYAIQGVGSPPTPYGNLRIVLILTKSSNNASQVFSTEIPNMDTTNFCAIKAALLSALGAQIRDAFGFSPSSTIAVKDITQLAGVTDSSSVLATEGYLCPDQTCSTHVVGPILYFVANITLAVN